MLSEKERPIVKKFIKFCGSYEPLIVSGVRHIKGKEEVLGELDEFKKDEYRLELQLIREKTSEGRYATETFRFVEEKTKNSEPRITFFSYCKGSGIIAKGKLRLTIYRSTYFSEKMLGFYLESSLVKRHVGKEDGLPVKLEQYDVKFKWEEGKLPVLYLNDWRETRDYLPLSKEVASQWLKLIGGSFQGLLESVEKAESLDELLSVIERIRESGVEEAMLEYGLRASKSAPLFLLGSVYKELNDGCVSRRDPVKFYQDNHRYRYEACLVDGKVRLRLTSPDGKRSGVWTISSKGMSYEGDLAIGERKAVEASLRRNGKLLTDLSGYLLKVKGAKIDKTSFNVEHPSM